MISGWPLAAGMVASCLLIVACSSGTTDPAIYNDSARASAADNRAEAAIENVAASKGVAAVAPGLPVSKPANAGNLPPGFQGKWGLVAADCEFGRSDAKGSLTIDGDMLRFYESRGKARSIVRRSGNEIGLDVDMSGEGQTWTTHTELKLSPTGAELLRVEQSPTTTYRYKKC